LVVNGFFGLVKMTLKTIRPIEDVVEEVAPLVVVYEIGIGAGGLDPLLRKVG